MTENKDSPTNEKNIFLEEIGKLPEHLRNKLLEKETLMKSLIQEIEKSSQFKSMGFFISPEIEVKDGRPTPNFDKLSLNFLLDDFERPIQFFDVRILLGDKLKEYLIEKKEKDEYGQEYFIYKLKADENIEFFGTSISILRENCFDGIYDDLKKLGSSFIYSDPRGFIGALKTIDIHRNMLLQKFEKYVVVYAGAGSWLRGEKSNDFDVFVVVDDTDVKRMPRMQVKEQLTRIIWQMAKEVSSLTGVQVHTQVYLLTDFWDALKDAHPVMFTFLRDGVPFYDRGLYSAWKELLKLGKIKPSPEAIDMHMNVGNQLVDRAKKTLNDIMMNDIYYAVLNPAQAILMLKGFNPTTPKETVKMFRDVLMTKEKIVTEKDVKTLELAVKMFKDLEHNRELQVKGKEIDTMLSNVEHFLNNSKKIFEEISTEKTKDSFLSYYNEFISKVKQLPEISSSDEKSIISEFERSYVSTGILASFVKSAIKDIVKSKQDYDSGKLTSIEVNKVIKEIRNVLSELKEFKERTTLSEIDRKKFQILYDDNKNAELFSYSGEIYLIDFQDTVFKLNKDSFSKSTVQKKDLIDTEKFEPLKVNDELILKTKKALKAKEILF